MTYPTTTLDWLKTLIAFDTVSRNSNLALINCVSDYCKSLGLEPILTFNADKTKANLFVTVPAILENETIFTGGFVLSGHTDVVPVDGQAWTYPPFELTIKDGKAFGRGTADMKGFIACCLTILPKAVALSQAGKLQKPIHLAFSYDEEVGCLGAPFLLADIERRGIKPDYCIVGEPTMMTLVTAHKGIQVYRCRVHGKSAHSSLTPQGVNAISYASKIIGFIDDLTYKMSQAVQEADIAFDVPFSTLSVGTIHGGVATNIVPNLCEFTFDYRNLPHMSDSDVLPAIQDFIATLLPKMHAIDRSTGIELIRQENVPAMTDTDSEALQALIINLVEEKHRHKVAYATEGGQFTQAGIPTVICGCGDIGVAHQADEYVSLEQLDKCERFLGQIVQNCVSG